MATILRMPAILAGAADAAVRAWLVAEGAVVVAGQPLAEIEADKATVELTAEAAGTIGRLLVAEGATVSVGDPVLVQLAEGENQDAIAPALVAGGVVIERPGSEASVASPVVGERPGTTPTPVRVPEPMADVSTGSTRLFASPLVRRLAAEHGIALADIEGTGPNGRIVRRDLDRWLAAAPSSVPPATPASGSQTARAEACQAGTADLPELQQGGVYVDVPLDRMRRTIARRLTESKATVPHFYLMADCRVDALLSLRAAINESTSRKISVNDLVLKAVAVAFGEVPEANAIWNETSIRRFSSVDIAIAVATDGGLMTPVLRGVELMPLTVLSASAAELTERARDGRLRQHELEGGSFSVSNLGMYGISRFSAILNPPQSGILAVGAARTVPVAGLDGEVTTGQVMTVTLSADHRVLDGALAARWLAAFTRSVENPLTILV